ncbi:MAG: sigma-54 dependent transcriptional regulator [Mariprofundaceae bacterium]|nr:sigma-54 dependent transcriptional regulator [Mariprofundaceae bacterium]
MMANILLVEDEWNARQVLSLGLETVGHEVLACANPNEAEQALKTQVFDVVLTDLRMEGRDAGLEVIRMAADLCPQAQILLLTAYASAATAVEAMREGAFDYLTKPVSSEELSDAVERALSARQEQAVELEAAKPTKDRQAKKHAKKHYSPFEMVGESLLMQRVKDRLSRASKRDFTVLITGESGTGKELAARFVHMESLRSKSPFVAIHCGAMPEGLFESELFGHRKGAFTSADHDRIGLVESAQGGTLFLDEIGEMPLSIQVKLLRVLQEKNFRPVGSDDEIIADIRIVAATNRDLMEEVKQGRFREDLFYRLNVIPVHLPALRQRREDIPDIVAVLVERAGGGVTIPKPCMEALQALPLLGNVRELENILQRLMALSDDNTLDVLLLDDMSSSHDDMGQWSLAAMQREGLDLDQVLETVERQLLQESLDQTEGNATQAAKLLGLSFRSIRYRLKKLAIKDA